MSDVMKLQAIREGISVERLALIQNLGISIDEAKTLSNVASERLEELDGLGFSGQEILAFHAANNRSLYGIETYSKVREFFNDDQISAMMNVHISERDAIGLGEQGLSYEEIVFMKDHFMKPEDIAFMKELGLTVLDLQEADRAGMYARTYLDARKRGFEHDELIEVASALGNVHDSWYAIDRYLKARSGGISRKDFAEVFAEPVGNSKYRDYVRFRAQPFGFDHAVAIELIAHEVDPGAYADAIKEASPDEIWEAIRHDIDLVDYAKFRDEYVRITHREIIDYSEVTGDGDLRYMNEYIRLIDSGISNETLRGLSSAGLQLWEILKFSRSPYDLSIIKLEELAGLSISPSDYTKLIDSGMSHASIVAADRELTIDSPSTL